MYRLSALGVITDKPIPGREKIRALFNKLTAVFEKESTVKEEVVEIIKEYLPNFEHIEKDKSLDSKM